MRIALLTYSTKPRGGVVHTLALAEALAEAGQQVTVWSLARGGDDGFFRPVDPRVAVRLVPFPTRDGESVGERVVRSIQLLARAFSAAGESFEVVHTQDCITANAVPGRLRTVHHLDRFSTPQLADCHERAITGPVAHVCVSAFVAEQLRAGWGLQPVVIPNGVDAARFAAADGSGWGRRLGRYVLAVGGIEPRKGTLDLITGMAAVQRAEPDVPLVVAGGETLFDYRDYRAEVEARIAELGVAVQELGPVPHDDLPGLVAGSSAFAFPSTAEGFGLAAMEALAARRPVVVRDLPVLREVFGEAVTYARDAAALGAALLGALGGGHAPSPPVGSRLAARHTWAAAARTHLELYRELRAAGVPIGTV